MRRRPIEHRVLPNTLTELFIPKLLWIAGFAMAALSAYHHFK